MKKAIYFWLLITISFSAFAQTDKIPVGSTSPLSNNFKWKNPNDTISRELYINWGNSGGILRADRIPRYYDLQTKFLAKMDSINNDGYVTHGYFNNHAVNLFDNQTIDGFKTFLNDITAPTFKGNFITNNNGQGQLSVEGTHIFHDANGFILSAGIRYDTDLQHTFYGGNTKLLALGNDGNDNNITASVPFRANLKPTKPNDVARLQDLPGGKIGGAYTKAQVDSLHALQPNLSGNNTFTGTNTYTDGVTNVSINAGGINARQIGIPNPFYGFNPFDGIFAITSDRGSNLLPYDLAFNRDGATVHLKGPTSITEGVSKIQTLQDKNGIIANLDDIMHVGDNISSRMVNLFDNQSIGGNKSFMGFTSLNNFAMGDGTTLLTTGNSFSVSQDFFHNELRWIVPNTNKGPAISFLKDGTNTLTFQYFNGGTDINGGVFNFNGTLKAQNAPVDLNDVVRLQDLPGSTVHGVYTKSQTDSVSSNTTQNQILLYDKSYYTDLTDFRKTGSFTPSVTNVGSILMTGGVSGTDTTNYIRLKGFTNNDELINFEVTYVVNNVSGYGISIGRKSISPTADYSVFSGYDLQNNIVSVLGVKTAASNITVAVNDICRLSFSIRAGVITTTFYDITQNLYATVSNVNTIINAGDLVINDHGGSVTIKGIKAYSLSPRSPDVAFLGDSKLRNPINGNNFGVWASSLGITATLAGQSDKLYQLQQCIPYILKYIKPKSVIVGIGRNDILPSNLLPDSVKTEYADLVNQLTSANIPQVHFLPIPETVKSDQSALTHLIDSLTTRTIDVSPMWNNSLNLSGDGIHPNEAGARLMMWYVKRSGFFDTISTRYQPNAFFDQGYNRSIQNNNFAINQNINGLNVGSRSTINTDASASIYTTTVGSGYPFTNSNNLAVQSSGNTTKDIVFITNNIVRGYIKGTAGTMDLGRTDGVSLGYKLGVTGTFGVTGLANFGSLTASKPVFTDASKNLTTTGPGTATQFIKGDGSVAGAAGSATLDFPSTAAQTSSELTITVSGASDGDAVSIGVPNVATNANSCYTAWVSATNIVTIKFNNYSTSSIDPASGTFKVTVLK